ncbi:hypothetical protein SERLA73DRAFT_164450 [Serpula lacrymans var. lacrymans S7.3]|uniref:Cyclin-domain-containing protein n=1 Tax=Serpula lacrymans var. lacrymans (strain S7.3) TaxID=936435 RepID=F8QJN6_SERL3|nr:hypothetical protein SERLA73DRAFT_164450 [Serpula lacrymans var. lacrymans S7.3]
MSKLATDATGRSFVIDSYNIHRLVIAGVTVASKFFSDVFYTNSRYAKVGGLPQPELNQLELQFLLLNDFRLVISSDEMQRYAEQLILFSSSQSQNPSSPSNSSTTLPYIHRNTGPTQAMGAIDAFGGRLVPDRTHDTSSAQSAPYPQSEPSSSRPESGDRTPSLRAQSRADYEDDGASEGGVETEGEIETETEGGDTTDDEPTIRAPCSVASDSGDDSVDPDRAGPRLLDGDGRECDEDVGGADRDARRERGDLTPELKARRTRELSEDSDIGMASP